ncbi:MAG: putative basic amino acid antiporter YfcC [Tissierellia bacterium]|nr:putative basic amino acid antiporter YfcC [Tissierellia bacterium]
MESKKIKDHKFKIPHTYVLIFVLALLTALATYIIPAGQYQRVEDPASGRVIVDAGSFEYIDRTPVTPFGVMRAIPQGMSEAASIIFLIFIVGGAFGIINGTGAIVAGLGNILVKWGGNAKIIIPLVMIVFSLGGATFGMAESTLIFIPMAIVIAKGMGLDSIVAMAMVYVGANIGFAGGAMNPWTVGVAQTIAGLPLFSGMGFRIIGQIVFLIASIWYVLAYSKKIKADPTKSPLYSLEDHGNVDTQVLPEFTTRHKLVLLVILAGFGFIIWGTLKGKSTTTDLTAIFLTMGIISGFVGGSNADRIASDFVDGAKSLTFGALIVGLARAISVILVSGNIIDTVIFHSASVLSAFPPAISAIGMFWLQTFINFFINSGSGQAATTMPLMAPIGDLVGISRQTVVLAFQYGDGFSNSLFPTAGAMMAGLALAKIPYEKWFKWLLPLMGVWMVIGSVLIAISVLINYGPF